MRPEVLRFWHVLHRWCSLVSALFVFLLCLTGLPLIFAHEIEQWTEDGPRFPAVAAGAPRHALDALVGAAVEAAPGKVPLYIFAEADDPDRWYVKLDRRVDGDERHAILLALDARSGQAVAAGAGNGFMATVYRLHVDLFAGLPGRLLLGAMGLALIVALVSGFLLYAPFKRGRPFGEVRRQRSRRLRWFDLHTLLGAVVLGWLLVVAGTGVVNSGADLILRAWQQEQQQRLAAGQGETLFPAQSGFAHGATPIQTAVDRTLAAFPDMQLAMLAYPGTLMSTPQYFAVILQGKTPLTARLRQVLLVDPASGEVLRAGARPWYVSLFQLSQPLHFGDYGGLPLKILWAAFDVLTLVVLGSGVYLWLARGAGRRRRSEST